MHYTIETRNNSVGVTCLVYAGSTSFKRSKYIIAKISEHGVERKLPTVE